MTDFWSAIEGLWNGGFWSGWVMTLVVINYGTILLLFLWAPRVKIPTIEDGTTGHVWDGGRIREGLEKLPKWWLIISTIGFISAFAYLVRYPAFGDHKGTEGWTSYEQMQQQLAELNAKSDPLWQRISNTPVSRLGDDEQAMDLGKRLFDDNCGVCHGFDAEGNEVIGAPSLTDAAWQFGGSAKAVSHSIAAGRHGVMPPWLEPLGYGKVKNVAHYVLSLSGAQHNRAAAAVGERVFSTNCAVCHGADGKGNPLLGAPNLTDNVWKWGGDLETVIHTIAHGRNGQMPNWGARLNENEIHLLTAWVLSHDASRDQANSPDAGATTDAPSSH